jgi:hypothetical protein
MNEQEDHQCGVGIFQYSSKFKACSCCSSDLATILKDGNQDDSTTSIYRLGPKENQSHVAFPGYNCPKEYVEFSGDYETIVQC